VGVGVGVGEAVITKTDRRCMMRNLSWMLLVLLVFSVYAEDGTLVAVGSAQELKGITAKRIIWKKDEAEMVLIPYEVVVVPREIKPAVYDEFGDLVSAKIVVPEYIDSLPFYMDAYEVTVGQFKKFLKSSGYKPSPAINWNNVYAYSPTEKHPMIYVNWHDATAYSKWAGKRLPTEDEWKFAARGGLENKEYPWGNDVSLARDYANYAGTGGKDKWDKTTAPVGRFKPNGYGLFDIAGNVEEWCQGWSDSKEGGRGLRGGGWSYGTNYLRVAYRVNSFPNDRINNHGFRCVVSGSN